MKNQSPPDGAAAEALRLALSHLEKARALGRESGQARAAGQIDEARFTHLQEFYRLHIRRAEQRIAHLQDEHRRRSEAIRRELQDVARRQADLSDRVAAREVAAEKANRLNRQYVATINELRERFKEEERLATADRSEQVGGFVERPLESYTPAPVATRAIAIPRFEPGRILTVAAAFAASLSVFWPWLAREGQAQPLAQLAQLPGLEGFAFHPLFPLVLVAIAVGLPLVTAAFAWAESRRGFGVVQLAAALTSLVLPAAVLALAAWTASGDRTLSGVLSGVRPGLVAYVASGAMLTYLALQRRRTVQPSAPRQLLWLGGMAGAAAVLCVFLTVAQPAAVGLSFEVSTAGPGASGVNVTCANTGSSPARLYIPWPGGDPGGPLVEGRGHAYGALVYVREEGSDAFRLYPDSGDCWSRQGLPVTAGASFEVSPGAVARLEMDPRPLLASGLNPVAVRVAVTNARGQTLGQVDVSLRPRL